jgi:hypothetical protein
MILVGACPATLTIKVLPRPWPALPCLGAFYASTLLTLIYSANYVLSFRVDLVYVREASFGGTVLLWFGHEMGVWWFFSIIANWAIGNSQKDHS